MGHLSYFGYGSNLNPEIMKHRIGGKRPKSKIGHLPSLLFYPEKEIQFPPKTTHSDTAS